MYFVSLGLLLVVLPGAFVCSELFFHPYSSVAVLFSAGRWWTFWAVGVRLFTAGLRQVFQPRFTAEEIFELREAAALPIVREVGFGNLAIGTLGCGSLWHKDWLVSAAIVGGLFYGLAGFGHLAKRNKNAKAWTAMISDLLVFLLLGAFVWRVLAS